LTEALNLEETRKLTLYLAQDEQVQFELGIQMFPFHHYLMGLLRRRTASVLSSGIYHQLRKLEHLSVRRYHGLKSARETNPSPLNLNSNILTLFIIYFACIVIAVFSLNLEYIYFSLNLFLRFYRNRVLDYGSSNYKTDTWTSMLMMFNEISVKIQGFANYRRS